MLKVTIEAEGRSNADVVDAIKEALRLIEDGNYTGGNSNDTGSFSFKSEGQDDYDHLTESGWEYDGEVWRKGRMTRGRTYAEALKEEENA